LINNSVKVIKLIDNQFIFAVAAIYVAVCSGVLLSSYVVSFQRKTLRGRVGSPSIASDIIKKLTGV